MCISLSPLRSCTFYRNFVIPFPVLEKKNVREEISVLCPLCVRFFSFRKFKKAGERNKEKMFSPLLFASSLEKKEITVN